MLYGRSGCRSSDMFERIREDVRSVFARDPAARHTFEILTCYPGLHAVLIHRLGNALWRRGWQWPARFVSHLGRFLTGIEIHPGATIGRRFFIDHGMGVVIGETAEIGDDCTLYHGVTLGGTSWDKGKRHPTLETGVVIGAGAKVLGPVTVGANARVGSNAVVVKDVPPGATVVGIPGRVVQAVPDKFQQRAETARRLGFDAYGEVPNMPDPVSQALDSLLDHAREVESEITALKRRLDQAEAGVAADAERTSS
jgi:serine O-acetyltransferase